MSRIIGSFPNAVYPQLDSATSTPTDRLGGAGRNRASCPSTARSPIGLEDDLSAEAVSQCQYSQPQGTHSDHTRFGDGDGHAIHEHVDVGTVCEVG